MEAVRILVSGKKHRFVSGEYNLDLTYITPRIIAMSFPGEGLEKLFRNSGDTVAKFLHERHRGKFRSYNLSGIQYNYEKFGNAVVDFPWPDHHAPPVDLLFRACMEMSEWLRSDPENVTVVHCKAGKGRTGTLICCYLLFCGKFHSPVDAMKYYRCKRFYEGGGVTQPSQKRYIEYFHRILTQQVRSPLRKLLSKVILKTAPHYSSDGSRPVLEILSGERLLFSSRASSRDQQPLFADNWDEERMHYILIPNGLALKGDILCRLWHWGLMGATKICRFSFNTSFIPSGNVLPLPKTEIDPDNFYKSSKCSDSFQVFVVFQDCCSCTADMPITARCEACREELGAEEEGKWQEIADILRRTENVRREDIGSQTLFGTHTDDIAETLSRVETP